MKDIKHYRDEAIKAKRQVEYIRRRMEGVKQALKGTSNEAVKKALNTEMNQLKVSLTKENNKVKDCEHKIDQIRRGHE